jgi:hypothetical protein
MQLYNSTRGIKNNNLGNIKKNLNLGLIWLGEINGPDVVFSTFLSPQYGVRAIYKILLKYYNNYQLLSINQIIDRYAPNNNINYKNFIINDNSKPIEFFNLNSDISLNKKENLFFLTKKIIYFENGKNNVDLFLAEQNSNINELLEKSYNLINENSIKENLYLQFSKIFGNLKTTLIVFFIAFLLFYLYKQKIKK